MNHTAKWIIFISVVLLGLATWFAWPYFATKPTALPSSPVMVTTTIVTDGSMPLVVNAIGNIVPIQQTYISPKQNGYIKQIEFTEGQNVNKGQILIQLDDDVVQANLAADAAQMNFDLKVYRRYKSLLHAGGVSRERVEEALSTYQIAQAKVVQDQINLANTTLSAPFSGTMGANNIAVGQFVTAGQNLAQLIDQSKFRIEYTVPGNMAKQLQLGQPVKIMVPLAPPEIFTGTVTFIAPFIDPQSGTVTVHAVIPAPQVRILSGTFVQVTQSIGTKPHVLLVPEQSIVPSLGSYHVFTVVNGKADGIPVNLGNNHHGMVEITQGLKAGSVIVVTGAQNLKDGQTVSVSTTP
jgi:membrane fusion protein (multidrug efflux system)